MFDLNKLGDMASLAGEAKRMQERQERAQHDQMELLKKISGQLAEIVVMLKERKAQAC